MVDVPGHQFSRITKIEIYNFERFLTRVVINNIEDVSNLIGLYDTIKKDIFAAIYFALGATATDLRVTNLAELKNFPDATMYVQLEIKAPGFLLTQTVRRELRGPNNAEFLFDHIHSIRNDWPATMNEYLDSLKKLKYDFRKQFYFYDAYNRDIVWNKFTCEQDELIALLTNSTGEIRRLHQYFQMKSKLTAIEKTLDDVSTYSEGIDSEYEKLLPDNPNAWENSYNAFVTSHLKCQEDERIKVKAKLVTVEARLAATNANIENFQERIDAETVARDRKAQFIEHWLQLRSFNWDKILNCTHQPALPDTATVLSMDIELLHLRNLMQRYRLRIENNKTLIRDLERYKVAVESNITFMNNSNGTRAKSNMITEDALLKIYPIYHIDDHREMDSLELRYLEKQEELNSIEHKSENFQYFEKVLPLQRVNPVINHANYSKIEKDVKHSIKEIVHPNAYLCSFDEKKLDYLSSLIPSSRGFLLCKAFKAVQQEHIDMICNILHNYKYTVVVYSKQDMKIIYATIKNHLPEWYESVRFLVLRGLSSERGTRTYTPPRNHWLSYCTNTIRGGNNRAINKLMRYLGEQKLKITCVERMQEVVDEFGMKSDRYIASFNGKLVYSLSMTGIKVLMYFAPGEEVEHINFPDVCDRLKDAHCQFGEWMSSTFTATEVVPQRNNIDVVQTNDLRVEVDHLQNAFLSKKDDQINQMEALRERMNRPYDVSDIQDYAQPLEVKQSRLRAIIRRINELKTEIDAFERIEHNQLRKQNQLWTQHIKYLTDIDKYELEIDQHNKTIKTNEEQRKKNDECKFQLEVERDELNEHLKNLKYRTIRTVVLASREGINWARIRCTPSPANLFQAIANAQFIDPQQISTHFDDMTDTFNRDIFYGKREWYDRLNRYETAITEMRRDLRVTTHGMRDERLTLLEKLKTDQRRLNDEMNTALISFAQRMPSNFTIKFQMKNWLPRVAVQMMKYSADGCEFRFEDLAYLDQICAHWAVFAGLHRYSQAPFVFIDLTNVPKDIIDMIAPLLEHMKKHAQLFINSSDIYHIRFADIQFAPNIKKIENYDDSIQLMRHDGRKCVISVPNKRGPGEQGPDEHLRADSHRGPDDGEREPNEADRVGDDL